jgi:hypothetical protein
VVRTTSRTTRTIFAGVGAGGVLAASAVALVLSTGAPANAAATTSTAFGVSASGVDPVGATPSVSSDGAVKTASGSVSGKAGTFSATGITVKAGAGVAESTVSSLTVGGKNIGSVSAKCSNGKTSYSHSGGAPAASNLKVSFGGGAGATVQIIGAGGKAVETITVAVVKCGTGTPPTSEPTQPPTHEPTGKPTQPPTGKPTGKPTDTHKPTGTHKPGQTPGERPDQPAPKPTPRDGHHPVTG